MTTPSAALFAIPAQAEPLYWTLFAYVLVALDTIANHLHELLLAVAGTFVGAWMAFLLERRDRKRAEINSRVAEGNLALLTIWQMWEVLNQFKKDVIDRTPHDNAPWLNMPATPPEQPHEFRFDPGKLHFLFEGRDKNILPQLILEQRRFYSALILINRRSSLMLDKIWPRLSLAGIEISTPGTERRYNELAICDIIGSGLVQEAKQIAPALVTNVTENLASFRATYEKLRAQLIEQLPGQKFVRVEFEPSQQREGV